MSLAALQEMTQAHAAEMAELRLMGVRIARAVTAEAETAEKPEDKRAAATLFPAVARAVRQCQALEARARRAFLKDQHDAERREREAADAAEAGARRRAEAAEQARRAELRRLKAPLDDRVSGVLEALYPDAPGEDHAEAYERASEDLRTRLDDETFEDEFADVPYEEAIARIHRDLSLPPPQFGALDRIHAARWAAQWAERAQAAASDPAPPDPPGGPPVTYSSG